MLVIIICESVSSLMIFYKDIDISVFRDFGKDLSEMLNKVESRVSKALDLRISA